MSYFCEALGYQPIKMFLNSNAADIISSRGDITFDLRRDIALPSGTTVFVSLNELTIPNTNYNINTSNNTLVSHDSSLVETTLTATKGNYMVTTFQHALNALFAALAIGNSAKMLK